MISWYIGCSGFSYKHWLGRFYPQGLAQRKWFAFYCEQFNTLELNVTFYRFPKLQTLQNWYTTSPAGFRFAVKAPKGITHYKQFHNSTDLITRFYSVINEGLQEKLGPVLFQMPSKFSYSEERLERILTSLDPAFKNVLEIRHESWWREDVYEALAKHHITFCGMSHPQLPDDIIQNTPVVYYRFHGTPDLYRSPYSSDFLQRTIDVVKQNSQSQEAWLFFNNDIDASAIDNAKETIKMAQQ
jgi:uncharacterized protein YecE (DUF72 family)